jgi:hypothetical protein
MVLSVVPPPVASKPFCHGHHARAFTAALCPFKVNLYLPAFMSQMTAVLSLLPDANPEASCLSPHTSALCPSNLDITLFGLFMSRPNIVVSLEPENNTELNDSDDTRL